MDELISTMQFRTAIPFGYLIFALILLISSLWAAKSIFHLCWKKNFRSVKLYFALGLLLVNSAYAYVNIAFEHDLNLNPTFVEADVFGEWQDGNSRLSLLKDGTAVLNLDKEYRTRLGLENGKGYWNKHQDFEISIGKGQKESGSKSAFLRVVIFNSKYRIIDYPEDGDMWDGDLGFKRENIVKENQVH